MTSRTRLVITIVALLAPTACRSVEQSGSSNVPARGNPGNVAASDASILSLGFGSAPGWRQYRTFSLVAASAALYCALDCVFTLPVLGLGLPLSMGLMRYLGGDLRVASGPSGTTMSMVLPQPD